MTGDEQRACAVKLDRLKEAIASKGGPSLGSDWWVECEQRKAGSSQGNYDYYYFHVDATSGKTTRFRSITEVARHLHLEVGERKKKVAKKAQAAELSPPDEQPEEKDSASGAA